MKGESDSSELELCSDPFDEGLLARSVQWEKHLGTECRLDLKMLESNATPLTQLTLESQQLGLLQKCSMSDQ